MDDTFDFNHYYFCDYLETTMRWEDVRIYPITRESLMDDAEMSFPARPDVHEDRILATREPNDFAVPSPRRVPTEHSSSVMDEFMLAGEHLDFRAMDHDHSWSPPSDNEGYLETPSKEFTTLSSTRFEPLSTCPISGCGKTLSTRDGLRRHCETHGNSVATYPCPFCERHTGEKAFKRKDKLQQHVRNMHRTEVLKFESATSCTHSSCPVRTCKLAHVRTPGNIVREGAEDLGGLHGSPMLSACTDSIDRDALVKSGLGKLCNGQVASADRAEKGIVLPRAQLSEAQNWVVQRRGRARSGIFSLGVIMLDMVGAVVINNHHDVLAGAVSEDGHCTGSFIPLPTDLKNILQLEGLKGGDMANMLLLAAMSGHAIGTSILLRKTEGAGAWLLGGVVSAFGLGLFTNDPFHAATLDFMPWTIFTAALLGAFTTRKFPRKYKRDEHDHEKHSLSAPWDLLERGEQGDESGYPAFEKTPSRDLEYERQEN